MRLIVSILLIIISVFVFAGYVSPAWKGTKTLRAEERRFDEALTRSNDLIKLREALLQSYNTLPPQDLAKLDTMLPNSVDSVRLIIDLNAVASRHDMAVSNISLGDVGEESTEEGFGPKDDRYGTLRMSFAVSGTYAQFRSFIGDLERSLRLIDIDSISFGEADEDTGLITYTTGIKTYWIK